MNLTPFCTNRLTSKIRAGFGARCTNESPVITAFEEQRNPWVLQEYVASMPLSDFVEALPAFLILLVERFEELDVAGDAIISRLDPPLTHGDPRASWLREVARLPSEARNAVADVLVAVWERYGCFIAKQALDGYWANGRMAG